MKKTGCSWLMNRGQCSTAIAGTIEPFHVQLGFCSNSSANVASAFPAHFHPPSFCLSVCLSLSLWPVYVELVSYSLSPRSHHLEPKWRLLPDHRHVRHLDNLQSMLYILVLEYMRLGILRYGLKVFTCLKNLLHYSGDTEAK